jgi:FMN phosphatase YigB (HAD superfamily)
MEFRMRLEEHREIPIPMVTSREMAEVRVVVWDADGSLYPHDSPGRTFTGSTLHHFITLNTITYIQQKEHVPAEKAKFILWQAQQEGGRMSDMFINRYHTTQKEYYDAVWGPVNPKDVVKNAENAVALIRKFHREGKDQILLTASPDIWQQHLVEYLGIADCFRRRYYAELFNKKYDVFSQLAREFDPSTIASFGDQMQSDIEPASYFGMKVFHITSPQSLLPFLGK